MRREQNGGDDGAILLFVLVIVTVLALGIAAVVEFSFDSPHAISAQLDHQRVVNALDVGLQAAVENAERGQPTPCDGTALGWIDDGLSSPTLPALSVQASCVPGPGGSDTFSVIARQTAVGAGQPTNVGLCLLATATIDTKAMTGSVTSWALGSLTGTTCGETS